MEAKKELAEEDPDSILVKLSVSSLPVVDKVYKPFALPDELNPPIFDAAPMNESLPDLVVVEPPAALVRMSVELNVSEPVSVNV